jgi:hypothetical protein
MPRQFSVRWTFMFASLMFVCMIPIPLVERWLRQIHQHLVSSQVGPQFTFQYRYQSRKKIAHVVDTAKRDTLFLPDNSPQDLVDRSD